MTENAKNLFEEDIPPKPPTPKGPRITVNGVGISQDEINREAQYHPADNLFAAKKQAAEALTVRELLLQEAIEKSICEKRPDVKDEEDVIEKLLAQEINVPEPDTESCRRYFEQNKNKFRTPPLYEVSHILIAAPPNKQAKRAEAKAKVKEIIEELNQKPDRFSSLAKKYSACSSSGAGGLMGQISKGQTTVNFEEAVFQMKKGEISAEPVETHFGYHVIKVHECDHGKDIDFKAVEENIADYLRIASWQRAVSQYLQILAGKAEIKGISLKGAKSPLVQ